MRYKPEGKEESNEHLGKVKNIKIEHNSPNQSSTEGFDLMSPEEVSEYFDNIPMDKEKKNGKN